MSSEQLCPAAAVLQYPVRNKLGWASFYRRNSFDWPIGRKCAKPLSEEEENRGSRNPRGNKQSCIQRTCAMQLESIQNVVAHSAHIESKE